MAVQRARAAAEKQGRRRTLLAAGLKCFEAGRFHELTMAQVAKEAGLAKGTTYLYFKSKEELFLALAQEALVGFFDQLDAGLASGRLFFGPEELAALAHQCLTRQPHLPRLLAILHSTLEYNVDKETAQKFREFLAERSTRTGRILEQRLPSLRDGEGVVLLLRLQAVAVGCWQVADAAPVVRDLLENRKLKQFRTDFKQLFTLTFSAVVAGMEEQSRRKR